VVEGHVRHRDAVYAEDSYRPFIARRFEDYRRLVAEGRGAWHGAFIGGRLAADCGLFREGETGRYQYVLTHPEHRRRGVAATLVQRVGDAALGAGLVRRLVISAADEAVARIYASVGFEPLERCAALILAPA
jgi:GNAT superfamily N-acetyltransferase